MVYGVVVLSKVVIICIVVVGKLVVGSVVSFRAKQCKWEFGISPLLMMYILEAWFNSN